MLILALARSSRVICLSVLVLAASIGPSWAQSTAAAQPDPEPPAAPSDAAEPAPAEVPASAEPAGDDRTAGMLRLHIVSTRNTYVPMTFDIFDVATQTVVASGRGADESLGQTAPSFELAPGFYKIVRAGEQFETRVDFAAIELDAGEEIDFVIVVDAETLQFRGAGPVTGDLPTGTRIAGIRIALNAGGSLSFNQRSNVVGGTSGTTALVGLFGNFSLVFDRGSHFLSVTSDLALNLNDPAVARVASTQDRWDASALYAFNLGNPYVGPYARASFSTKVFPGYLFLEDNAENVLVEIHRADGTVDQRLFGTEANQDDLRIKVAKPFAPIVLQEEIGGNLKAVDLDLLLLKLSIATRLGFGFRQGIMNELLVVDGDDKGTPITLVEVEDYSTLGPVVGAGGTVTFARWLFGTAQFGMLVPLKDRKQAGEGVGEQLLFDFTGTAGLKLPQLTSFLFASFDYSFRLQRDGFVTSDVQFDHTLMARMNLSLF